jgi:hypothetical protein
LERARKKVLKEEEESGKRGSEKRTEGKGKRAWMSKKGRHLQGDYLLTPSIPPFTPW